MHNGDAHDEEHGAAGHGYGHGGRAPRGFRETFLIPFAIPVSAALTIFAIILCVSQILLAVPSSVATPIALCIALAILLGCAYLASAPRLDRQILTSFIGVPVLILVGFGIFAGVYRQENPKHEGGAVSANAGGGPASPPDEVTTDNKFSVTSYTVEAGKPVTINVSNKGAAVHNFDILNVKDDQGNAVKTELLQPGTSASLTFTLGTEGSYNFQCDVHPTEMKGTITVTPANTSASAATRSAGPGATGGLAETTTDNKFSQTSLTATQGVPVGLTVQNKGAALHNVHIMGGAKNADGSDIKTELVPAGQSATITFQIDQAGTYAFQCDVHPTEMKGTLTVK